MGGFFGGPSSPPPVSVPTPTVTDTSEQDRLDAIERNRRGLAGTIATSDRGVLTAAGASAATAATGKRLLGE